MAARPRRMSVGALPGPGAMRRRRNSTGAITAVKLALPAAARPRGGSQRNSRANSKEASGKEANVDPEEELEEDVDGQLELVQRFRKHLVNHFGDAVAAFEALDVNLDGDVSFTELMSSFDTHGVPEFDDVGPFDLRRIFHVLDIDGSGSLSCDELMTAPFNEIEGKIADSREKAKTPLDTRSAMKNSCPTNTVERFRRIVLQKFNTLAEAFKALDVNFSGDVSFGELSDGLDRHLLTLRDELGIINLKQVFRAMDIDGSGDISIYEFQGLWPKIKKSGGQHTSSGRKKKKNRKSDSDEDADLLADSAVRRGRRQGQIRRRASGVDANQPQHRPAGASLWMQKIENFAQNTSAEQLDLKHACVGEWGAERLVLAMPGPGYLGMRSVKVLQLEGNYFGDPGTLSLARAIEEHCALQKLMLGRNGISDVGANRLCNTICMVASLEELSLPHNRITDEGGRRLAQILGRTPRPSIRKLDLQFNSIGPQGIHELILNDHAKLRLLLTGNYGLNNRSESPKAATNSLWDEDLAYTLKPRPFEAWRSPIGAAKRCSPISAAFAATLASEAGEAWEPAAQLQRQLSLAREIGLGLNKKRPSSQASLRRLAH